LRLDRSARWVAERYPIRASRELGDALEIELSITTERWLTALLLRLGPHAQVAEPEAWRTLGVDAAGELLARYAAPPGSRRR
jgi:predicted DNA-binding transcriptional regulator YafY